MAINTFEYATYMTTQLDQQVVREATSGWMEANAGQVEYNGGKTIKIPQLSTSGLGDYDRDQGHPLGKVTLTYDDYTMTQDRGTAFQLDAMDVNETNFVANATNVAKNFQRTNVIPEIDAYRYSRLYYYANEVTNTEEVTLTVDNTLTKLREHLRAVADVVGDTPLVISMTSQALANIEASKELTRTLDVGQFTQGGIKMAVKKIDEHVIKLVPSARMKTKYVFHTGADQFGFTPDDEAKNIAWILTPLTTPIAVSKTDKLRVFSPDVYQMADAWKIDYRKYHDLWVKKNDQKTVFACVNTTA